jgi:predicted ATPase
MHEEASVNMPRRSRMVAMAPRRSSQRQRNAAVQADAGATVLFDRSPACTLALSRYLGVVPPRPLDREVS